MKQNDFCIEGETAIILVKSKMLGNRGILIDKEDLEKIIKYRWYITKHENTFYARTQKKEGNKYKGLYMHRLIKECPEIKVIDHRNGNGLDNRKCNLKICTQKENSKNQKLSNNNTSGYRNIFWNKINNTWDVQIKHRRLGQFKSKNEAVKARNKYLIENMQDELFYAYDRQ